MRLRLLYTRRHAGVKLDVQVGLLPADCRRGSIAGANAPADRRYPRTVGDLMKAEFPQLEDPAFCFDPDCE